MRDEEYLSARRLANRVLGQSGRDPDDDLSVLARQLLRADERIDELERQVLDVLEGMHDAAKLGLANFRKGRESSSEELGGMRRGG
jgi:hypothetical protein